MQCRLKGGARGGGGGGGRSVVLSLQKTEGGGGGDRTSFILAEGEGAQKVCGYCKCRYFCADTFSCIKPYLAFLPGQIFAHIAI